MFKDGTLLIDIEGKDYQINGLAVMGTGNILWCHQK